MTAIAYIRDGASTAIEAIHDRPQTLEAGENLETVVTQASVTCRTADLPSGARQGDAVVVNGLSYTVRAILHDGTGMVRIELQRA